jgi:hypothetical protein
MGYGMLEDDDLLQKGILWPASNAVDDNFGAARVDPPVDIACKWVLETRSSTDPNSAALQVVGRVYVDREIPIDSILRKGCINNPGPEQLYEVVGYCEKPDVFCEEIRRYVEVALWNGRLPAGV